MLTAALVMCAAAVRCRRVLAADTLRVIVTVSWQQTPCGSALLSLMASPCSCGSPQGFAVSAGHPAQAAPPSGAPTGWREVCRARPGPAPRPQGWS